MLLNNVDFEEDKSLPTNGLVEIIYLSWFVNCIVPAKLGDAYRSYLLKRNAEVSFSSTIGTILAERVIDLLVLFGLLSVSFTLMGSASPRTPRVQPGPGDDLGGLMVLALIVGAGGLALLRRPHSPGAPSATRRNSPASSRASCARSSAAASRPFSATPCNLASGSGRLFFVTRSLDAHEVTLSAVIFIALLSSLLTTIPPTPGGAGLVEGAVVLSLGLFLSDQHLAVSIALLDRLINYWSLIVGGWCCTFSRRK